MKNSKIRAGLFAALLASTVLVGGAAEAMTLREALQIAMESNPEIGQSVENREAIEFELRQARGLYLPSVDLEASTGARHLEDDSRRLASIENDPLYPSEVGLTVTQKLFDGGGRRAELERQAARVDSASFRVLERSETIGLQIVREYFEYILQQQIVEEARRNVSAHQAIRSDISSLISGGRLTEADRQQVDERLLAAKARLLEAQEALDTVKISFNRLVGQPLTKPSMPKSVSARLPNTLDTAIGIARANNPRIKAADADINVADSQVKAARSDMLPEIVAEGRIRSGVDVDGSTGDTWDAQARIVARWNLYRGGIDIANEQEQMRRASEQRLVFHQAHREVEEAVRISWERRASQYDLSRTLKAQAQANDQLVSSYREQLAVGQRSLLDVLGAQNARFNANVLAKTAQYAALFAEYRLLAATGQLLSTMQIKAPAQAEAYARQEFNVSEAPATETYRRMPSRQTNDLPLDLLAPIRQK
ncbi:channel protein TolC [Sinorhizobium glycinis]|uniref:Channel protein TolC n=2 Tax=Sinorhizobium glycinis TaxID=1472378 RepID=A0A178Y6P0_9HYPH|nr:channel protein TolC [Sinorhizobium glycinis]